MFALIITIISIALVAALAIASIYYGGTTFSQGSAKAQASEVINQAQQVSAAVTLYQEDHQGSAAALEAGGPDISLLVPKYMQALPESESFGSNFSVQGTATQPVLYLTMPTSTFSAKTCLDIDKVVAPTTSVVPNSYNPSEPYWCNTEPGGYPVYFFEYNIS